MKTLSALFCGLLLSALPVSLHAQQIQPGTFKIDKITPSIIQTPQYQYSGEIRNPAGGQYGKWLEVEVQFESLLDVSELTVKYYVLLNNQAQTVLYGEVTHVNVPKSHELYSVMYVSPRSLASLFAGVPVTAGSAKVVGVQLLVKGQVVAETSSKASATGEWWGQYQQATGFMLNKNETPFAPLYWDRYEAIKSAAH